jgi:hypothetical protein
MSAMTKRTQKESPMHLKMEGIYYSAVVPRDPAILTLMGLVFDKVYFPNAYLPVDGFDAKELDKEIARLEQLPRDFDTTQLIGILKFLKHVPTLQGFCEFQSDSSGMFGDARFSEEAILQIYDSIYGPRPKGWMPMISSTHVKGLPGSDESVVCRGDLHNLANAIYESARTGLPLINDVPGLPVFSDVASPVSDSQALAGLLSVLCMKLLLPETPVLVPTDLMEFRDNSKRELRAFRRSMLAYAGELNEALNRHADEREIEKQARFFVETKIAPHLDELREIMSKRNLGWIGRSLFKLVPTVAAGYLTGGNITAIATLLTGSATEFVTAYSSSRGAAKEAKKSGLYYLLRAESITRKS